MHTADNTSEFEVQLVQEVRKYAHLYDPHHEHYKDVNIGIKAWTEISKVVGEQVCECTRRWKQLRDKYVRNRRKMRTDPANWRKTRLPSYFKEISWLAPFVKHRGATEEDDEEELSSVENVVSCAINTHNRSVCS